MHAAPMRTRMPQMRMMGRALLLRAPWRLRDQVRRGRMRMLAGVRTAQRPRMSRLRIGVVGGRGRARMRIE